MVMVMSSIQGALIPTVTTQMVDFRDFVPGTLVRTDKGDKSIESLGTNDRVRTRAPVEYGGQSLSLLPTLPISITFL